MYLCQHQPHAILHVLTVGFLPGCWLGANYSEGPPCQHRGNETSRSSTISVIWAGRGGGSGLNLSIASARWQLDSRTGIEANRMRLCAVKLYISELCLAYYKLKFQSCTFVLFEEMISFCINKHLGNVFFWSKKKFVQTWLNSRPKEKGMINS